MIYQYSFGLIKECCVIFSNCFVEVYVSKNLTKR